LFGDKWRVWKNLRGRRKLPGKAHRLLNHSTLGLTVINKKREALLAHEGNLCLVWNVSLFGSNEEEKFARTCAAGDSFQERNADHARVVVPGFSYQGLSLKWPVGSYALP